MQALVPKSDRLSRALEYWRGLKGDRDIPLRADFCPTDIAPGDLPNLILLDVHDSGADFTYRLVGSGVVGFIGHEFTGQSISEYQGMHEEPEMRDAYVAAAKDRRPTLYTGTLERFDREYVRYERLALPLQGEADGVVTQILAVFEFQYANSSLKPARSGLWPNTI